MSAVTWAKLPEVARWSEVRGFSLRLRRDLPLAGSDRFVRVSVVARKGFFSGWFNVREARAEPRRPGDAPQALGAGRLLSWRWLTESEADALFDARLRTLEAMRYEVLEHRLGTRDKWDWLSDLVQRGIVGEVDALPSTGASDALHDALTCLGLRRDEIVEGVAEVLGIHAVRFKNPDPETIARVDPRALAVLLPFLLDHEDTAIVDIGERWLAGPTTAYELPIAIVERWLRQEGGPAKILAPRLGREGLALLGPDALTRLARASRHDGVRRDAALWVRRLGGR